MKKVLIGGWRYSPRVSSVNRPLLPKPGEFPNEKALAAFVFGVLDQWFHIEEQVQGMYWTGEQTRIDAVLVPRNPTGWHDAAPGLRHRVQEPSSGHR